MFSNIKLCVFSLSCGPWLWGEYFDLVLIFDRYHEPICRKVLCWTFYLRDRVLRLPLKVRLLFIYLIQKPMIMPISALVLLVLAKYLRLSRLMRRCIGISSRFRMSFLTRHRVFVFAILVSRTIITEQIIVSVFPTTPFNNLVKSIRLNLQLLLHVVRVQLSQIATHLRFYYPSWI